MLSIILLDSLYEEMVRAYVIAVTYLAACDLYQLSFAQIPIFLYPPLLDAIEESNDGAAIAPIGTQLKFNGLDTINVSWVSKFTGPVLSLMNTTGSQVPSLLPQVFIY